MAREIERRFKVIDDQWRASVQKTARIVQGYLSTGVERVVRVRAMNDQVATITIKGVASATFHTEYEYVIPIADARELLRQLCLQPLVEKTRHYVSHGGLVWEIDEFDSPQRSLVIAEIKLPTIDHELMKPAWLGEEVTGNPLFYNLNVTFRRP